VCRLTASRHIASFPARLGVCRIAPESRKTVLRVATEVAGAFHGSVGVHAVVDKLMRVWSLRRPWLALLTGHRYLFLANVLAAWRCQSAVCHACNNNIARISGVDFGGEGWRGGNNPQLKILAREYLFTTPKFYHNTVGLDCTRKAPKCTDLHVKFLKLFWGHMAAVPPNWRGHTLPRPLPSALRRFVPPVVRLFRTPCSKFINSAWITG